MEIRVNRSEFLGELGPMQGIVERKTTIPVLSHLLLDRAGRQALTWPPPTSTSRSPPGARPDVKREGAIAVQAKKLVEIIRSLTGEEVLLVQEEPRVLYHPGRQVALQDPRPRRRTTSRPCPPSRTAAGSTSRSPSSAAWSPRSSSPSRPRSRASSSTAPC